MSLLHGLLVAFITFGGSLVLAQPLPPEVAAAWARARVPLDSVSLLVVDAEGQASARLSHRADIPVNPASVMKLVTTYAGIDLLGPAFTWRTPVYADGAVRDGVLYGNLYIKGQGDPKLVVERLWLLLRRVQGLGIESIAGDIVLDRSAFASVDADAASFDGEPLRPYNVAPDALLLNFKSMALTFVPERGTNRARVHVEPALFGVKIQSSVPLSDEPHAVCGDYRAALKADFADPARIRFEGSYPASCAEKVWSVAYADPQSYNARAVHGLWRQIGGQLGGTVREGRAPALAPAFEMQSPALADIIRDINKYSNNVMAQQLFLTLSLAAPHASGTASDAVASMQASRELLARWWRDRIGAQDAPALDNGSGLSRSARISAQALARLLQTAYRSPYMPELMSSLPIMGADGTLKRARALPLGSAHLKTGSLRDVAAMAGYVQAASGKRYVLVAMVNHASASAARPAFDALLDWTVRDN